MSTRHAYAIRARLMGMGTMANKNTLFVTLRSVPIPVFRQIRQIRCPYESLRYLQCRSGDILWTIMTTIAQLITLPLAHAHGIIILFSDITEVWSDTPEMRPSMIIRTLCMVQNVHLLLEYTVHKLIILCIYSPVQ